METLWSSETYLATSSHGGTKKTNITIFTAVTNSGLRFDQFYTWLSAGGQQRQTEGTNWVSKSQQEWTQNRTFRLHSIECVLCGWATVFCFSFHLVFNAVRKRRKNMWFETDCRHESVSKHRGGKTVATVIWATKFDPQPHEIVF